MNHGVAERTGHPAGKSVNSCYFAQISVALQSAYASAEEIRTVCRKIEEMGFRAHPIPGAMRTAIGITGNQGPVESAALEAMPGVVACLPVSKPYKLVARELKEERTIVDPRDTPWMDTRSCPREMLRQ